MAWLSASTMAEHPDDESRDEIHGLIGVGSGTELSGETASTMAARRGASKRHPEDGWTETPVDLGAVPIDHALPAQGNSHRRQCPSAPDECDENEPWPESSRVLVLGSERALFLGDHLSFEGFTGAVVGPMHCTGPR
jgi:hypothetical protein